MGKTQLPAGYSVVPVERWNPFRGLGYRWKVVHPKGEMMVAGSRARVVREAIRHHEGKNSDRTKL